MKVTVDYDICASTGACSQIAPEVFDKLSARAGHAVVDTPEPAIPHTQAAAVVNQDSVGPIPRLAFRLERAAHEGEVGAKLLGKGRAVLGSHHDHDLLHVGPVCELLG